MVVLMGRVKVLRVLIMYKNEHVRDGVYQWIKNFNVMVTSFWDGCVVVRLVRLKVIRSAGVSAGP